MISYDVFWETLKQKGVSQYSLIEKHGVSAGLLSTIRRGDYLSLRKIVDLCEILDCNIQDIVTYTPKNK